ncbi:hypothetical protein AAFN60_01880 [Roseibacillus persicicus]|uniref:hypothetical protein n=1 Tax=Roseibacillus persicicus TaxID=454148 RepID=UPI00398AB80D
MTLSHPSPDSCPEVRQLSAETRAELRAWYHAFSTKVTKPLERSLTAIGREMGVSYGTARRYYYAVKSSGTYLAIINKTREGLAFRDKPINDPRFLSHLAKRAEENQRGSRAGLRTVQKDWRNGIKPPGYENVEWTREYPTGWSIDNLAKQAKKHTDKVKMASIRVGTSSKTKAGSQLPQVLTTRVGLWPGAVYQIDDVWHDNFVTVGNSGKPTRVLQLGALDVLSGCYVHWGMKPRMPKEGGGSENLRNTDARLFIAGLLSQVGYSQRGTTIMAEHGTAAIEARIEELLHDVTGGKLMVKRQPIEGAQKALCQYWNGSEGGNFRAKAHLESWHNLMHNALAALPGQTGLDPASRPVETDRMLSYASKLIEKAQKLAPERAALLIKPLLDFHSEFVPAVGDAIRDINNRTNHELEGWAELGFMLREYTMLPGSGLYLPEHDFDKLPDATQTMLTEAARNDPATWSRRRPLSPAEVWAQGSDTMRKIPMHVVADILGEDLAREETVKGTYFRFHDKSISESELIYEARLRTPEGLPKLLRAGEKYQVLSNPFCPDYLLVCDAKFRCLGVSRAVRRENPITEPERFAEAVKQKKVHTAEIFEDLRMRHEGKVAEVANMKRHNERVFDDAPVTIEERSASRKAALAKTRAAKFHRETFREPLPDPIETEEVYDEEVVELPVSPPQDFSPAEECEEEDWS